MELQAQNFKRYLQILHVYTTPCKKSASLLTGHCTLPCPCVDRRERCPCPAGLRALLVTEMVACHCKAHLSSFATSLISLYRAFDRLAANDFGNCKDFSLSLFSPPSLSTHIAPGLFGPLSPFTTLDGVRPHCFSQAGGEITTKPDRQTARYSSLSYLHLLPGTPLFLWI